MYYSFLGIELMYEQKKCQLLYSSFRMIKVIKKASIIIEASY